MDPRVSLVFGRDIKYIGDLVSVIMTSSHPLLPEAMEIFNLCRQTDPNRLVLRLAKLLDHESTNVETRARSAILLRDMFAVPLDVITKGLVKYILLKRVEKEHERIVRKSLCSTIAIYYNLNGTWPELINFLRVCVSGPSDWLRETALLILGQLTFFVDDIPIPLEEYVTCLRNANSADVRIAAFGAVIQYAQCTDGLGFDKNVVGVMAQVLTEGMWGRQEVTTQEALKLLLNWAFRAHPGLSKDLWNRLVSGAFDIIESHRSKKETRFRAIRFLIALVEGGHYDSSEMLNRIFGNLIFDLENEAASHREENEGDDFYSVRNFLGRLAIQLDGDAVVVGLVLEQYYAAASDWQKRVAAIVALAQISKVYLKVTKKTFDQLVTMVLDSFQDPHPRVRVAAIKAIGQLSTDLGPDLQIRYLDLVLPALITTVCDFDYPQVEAHAASVMVNISKSYGRDILTPHLHKIVRKLKEFLCAQNDLASDETRCAINLLRECGHELKHDGWTKHPAF